MAQYQEDGDAGTQVHNDAGTQLNNAADSARTVRGRVFLRPLGNPLPLGFVGLGGATLALSSQQLHWIASGLAHQVALLVVLIAVPLQLLASVFGFLARDAVAATGMGTLAASWLSIGVLSLAGTPGSRSPVLGLALFYFAAAVLISAIVAVAGKALAGIVLALAAVRFVVTGVYEYVGGAGWMQAAGWIGVALCAAALYAALAFEVEDIHHSTVLPTLRRGAGRHAMTALGRATVGTVGREAGVREQL